MDARTPRPPTKARLKRIIAAGNVLAFGVGAWTFFLPTHFYVLGVALSFALPPAALALDVRADGMLGFEARRHGRYPLSLATILFVPSIALAARALTDLNFVSYSLLIAEMLLAAAAIFALFWRFDPRLRTDRNQISTIAIFAVVYAFGVLAFADVLLDPAAGHDTQTVIRAKRVHVSGGTKGSSVWYEVKVEPGASPARTDWIHVRPDLWDWFHRGDATCVHQGPGLLGTAWYSVRSCTH